MAPNALLTNQKPPSPNLQFMCNKFTLTEKYRWISHNYGNLLHLALIYRHLKSKLCIFIMKFPINSSHFSKTLILFDFNKKLHSYIARVFDIDVIKWTRIYFFGKNRFYFWMHSPFSSIQRVQWSFNFSMPST